MSVAYKKATFTTPIASNPTTSLLCRFLERPSAAKSHYNIVVFICEIRIIYRICNNKNNNT